MEIKKASVSEIEYCENCNLDFFVQMVKEILTCCDLFNFVPVLKKLSHASVKYSRQSSYKRKKETSLR